MASGTAPNTSLVLTDAEIEFINTHFNGSKSAAIHKGLEILMSWITRNYPIGHTMQAPHPADNEWRQCKVVNHAEKFGDLNGIVVQFDDGEIMNVEASFLWEDGRGV